MPDISGQQTIPHEREHGCGDANPLATADQLAAEQEALEAYRSPEVTRAIEDLKAQWMAKALEAEHLPAEALQSPDSLANLQLAAEEYAYFSALTNSARDPDRPRIVLVEAGPRHWFGTDVPGSRLINDNPDTIYRTAALGPGATYVVTGRMSEHRPADFTVSVLDDRLVTVAHRSDRDIRFAEDGTFTLTLGPAGAADGPDYVGLPDNAQRLFVRDTLNDWGVQQPAHLSVARVDGPAPRPAGDAAALVRATVAQLNSSLHLFAGLLAPYDGLPLNTLPPVRTSANFGMLTSQASSAGLFDLGEGDGLVVTVDLAGAVYFTVPVTTYWMTTTDFVDRTQSLNNVQAVADPDGRYTFVVSPEDPGVHNWIDTAGLRQGQLCLRWQALPPDARPAVSCELVKLTELASVLPPTTAYVTPAERRAQQQRRAAAYATRFADCDCPVTPVR